MALVCQLDVIWNEKWTVCAVGNPGYQQSNTFSSRTFFAAAAAVIVVMQSFNSMIYSNYNVAHAHQIYHCLDALWLRELVFISIGLDSIRFWAAIIFRSIIG